MIFSSGPGARWWKVDFHAHSPSSFDFGGLTEGKTSTVQISVRDWLLAYMRSDIDALVVADHNTHLGIDLARKELAVLRDESHEEFREIAIFAGVELTVDGNYHLLAIFDVDTESEVVNGLLHKVGYKGERGSSDSTTETTFEQAIAEISARSGLAIPAHADAKNAGLFGHNPANVGSIIESGRLRAIEVVGEEGAERTLSLGLVPVLGSDAHHLDASTVQEDVEAKYPGSHFTWVKMFEPTLDGLRAAISDGVDSVARSSTTGTNPNDIGHTFVERMVVRDDRGAVEHTFSPWMTGIIGGRGTGKSTLIEMIRLAMGRFDDLPTRLQEDLDWYSPVPGSDRVWNESTEIELHFVRSDRSYRVLWSGRESRSATIEVWDGDQWVHEAGDASERFPILINSQKQIYESAQDPQSLLKIIDAQPEINHSAWVEEMRRLTSQYKTERSQIAELRNQSSSEDRILGELADLQAEIEKRNQLEQSADAKELEVLLAEEAVLSQRDVAARELQADLESALASYDAQPRSNLPEGEWEIAVNREAAFDGAVNAVRGAAERIRSAREDWERSSADSPRNSRIKQLRTALAELTGGEESVESLGVLIARRASLEAQLTGVEAAKASLDLAEARAANTLDEVRSHRAALTMKRQQFAATLGNEELKVNVFAQADDTNLESDLRLLLRKPNAFDAVFEATGIRKVLASNPRDPRHLTEIDQLRLLLKDMRANGSDSPLMAALGLGFDQRLFTHLESLNEHDLQTDIDTWFPDDALQIRYLDPSSGNLINLDQGSPGQKTAALLTLALQMGTDPLILDQPEDDLDNRLIYDLVVKHLKRIKHRRQVIVVTHNANVVVNADAELVIVMEHGYPPNASRAGAIQVQDVKDDICLIMEGGRPAFENRYGRLLGTG